MPVVSQMQKNQPFPGGISKKNMFQKSTKFCGGISGCDEILRHHMCDLSKPLLKTRPHVGPPKDQLE